VGDVVDEALAAHKVHEDVVLVAVIMLEVEGAHRERRRANHHGHHAGDPEPFGDVTLRRVFSSTSFFCTVSGGSGPVIEQHHF